MSRNKIRLNELTQAIDQYADEAVEAGGEYERGRITRGIHAAAVKADELGKEAHDRGDVVHAETLFRIANDIRALVKT